MVLIKIRLLIFLLLSLYGLACKYIISHISIYTWMQIEFSDISGIAFSYFQDQITTFCDKSHGLSHNELRAL